MKISNIKRQVKRQDRYAVYIDDKYVFSLGESELLNSGLNIGQELSSEDLKRFNQLAVMDKALDRTMRFMSIRSRSIWEVQTYLKRKGYGENTSNEIIKKLTKLGFIDDESFTKAWVENRRLLKPVSKRRLIMELRQKRVDNSIIDKALEEDEVTDESTLRQLIEKRRGRYKNEIKLMQYLVRQGYNYQDVKSALESKSEDY